MVAQNGGNYDIKSTVGCVVWGMMWWVLQKIPDIPCYFRELFSGVACCMYEYRG